MFAEGMQQAIHRMANCLPQHILALHPRLMLIVAWRLIAQWQLGEARSLVAVTRDRLREMERATPDSPEIDELHFLVRHRESQIAHASYDIENLETECASVLRESPQLSKNPYLMGSFYNSLQYAQREQFKLAEIDKLDTLARAQVEKTNTPHGEIFIAGVSGPSYLLMGQADKAKEVLTRALTIAQRLAGRDDPLGSVVALSLAHVHYERNEIASAEALVEQYMPLAVSAGFVDQLVAGWIVRSRLQFLKGETDASLRSLEDAAEFGVRHDLERLRIAANAEQLRVLLRIGRPDEAARFARRRGLMSHRAASSSRGRFHTTRLDSSVALGICRLMAADDRFTDALRLARQWRSFVSAAQAVHTSVEWDVLVAELLFMSGEKLAAQRVVGQALARAAPSWFLRRFIDEGEPVAGLIRSMSQAENQAGSLAEDQVERFCRELNTCLGPPEDAVEENGDEEHLAIYGKLSGREIEILDMVASGMLNRQIGEKLGLTEGTVKWYLQQIFDKVGVRNRKQAVARARRLGILSQAN
jgi:LuxR family maltose regulon positive regulatory protein